MHTKAPDTKSLSCRALSRALLFHQGTAVVVYLVITRLCAYNPILSQCYCCTKGSMLPFPRVFWHLPLQAAEESSIFLLHSCHEQFTGLLPSFIQFSTSSVRLVNNIYTLQIKLIFIDINKYHRSILNKSL